MGEQTAVPPARRNVVRVVVVGAAVAQTLFLLYTWYYIPSHASPMGDGMEFAALVPLTIIFLVFVLPPLLLAIAGRWLAFAVILLLIGGAANGLLWNEILNEFAAHGR
jgi:hypothetical protein